jgi:hypothetical protein
MLLFLLAGASLRAGRPAEGVRPLDTAIEFMGAGDGTTLVPELYILKGDLVAALAADAQGGRADAERWYRLAFDRAGAIDARSSRLRSATRLARRLQADGEPEAAARTLGPIYATFTEGFATADLREARDLLDTVELGDHATT